MHQDDPTPKTAAELEYWAKKFELEKGRLNNSHYKQLMLLISGQSSEFFDGAIVADFGCGPRGSLEWMSNARTRIGVDVLVDDYMSLGIRSHNMAYVRSSESEIPLPSGYLDALFTINSLDHVNNITLMLSEIFRVLKTGGLFAASLNLDEPATPTEPQTITEDFINEAIIPYLKVTRFKAAPRFLNDNYRYLINWAEKGEETPPRSITKYGIAWLAGIKK
jgi:ubiquinone/menaquinone biosynthesis C-methylase UbiE